MQENFEAQIIQNRSLIRRQPKLLVDGPYGAPAQDYQNYDVLLLVGLGIGATPFISILRDLINDTRTIEEQTVQLLTYQPSSRVWLFLSFQTLILIRSTQESNTETTTSDESYNSFTSSSFASSGGNKRLRRTTNAYFYWVTREPGSFEWFKGVMDEVAELDRKVIQMLFPVNLIFYYHTSGY